MANTVLTPTIIAQTARVILENNMIMANKIYRDDEAFTGKIGTQHTIRLPNRFVSNTGKNLNVGEMAEPSSVITVNTQKHVDFYFDSDELTLTIERFAERYLKPALSQLANDIEVSIAGLYQDVYNSVGTAGATPSSYATSVQLINTKAGQLGWPQEGRCAVWDSDAYNTLAAGMTGLNYAGDIQDDALKRAYVPVIGGVEMYESQNIAWHTVGTYAGTPVTEAAGANGDTTTDTDGWSSGATTLNKGDVYTVAGVNSVNPQNRITTGSLQQFAVTSEISDTSGDIDIPHSPTITTTGAYQTVDAAPTDGQTVTLIGSSATAYPQNLAFHKDAFALAMADLVLPQGVDFAAMSRYNGISVRVVRAYDVNSDSFPCRIDVLYGVKTIYPELAMRVWG